MQLLVSIDIDTRESIDTYRYFPISISIDTFPITTMMAKLQKIPIQACEACFVDWKSRWHHNMSVEGDYFEVDDVLSDEEKRFYFFLIVSMNFLGPVVHQCHGQNIIYLINIFLNIFQIYLKQYSRS